MTCIQQAINRQSTETVFNRDCYSTGVRVSIRQHTSAYVSIRQHTSAYVSIRHARRLALNNSQFNRRPSDCYSTGIRVSIRQHTSAYVSRRPSDCHSTGVWCDLHSTGHQQRLFSTDCYSTGIRVTVIQQGISLQTHRGRDRWCVCVDRQKRPGEEGQRE